VSRHSPSVVGVDPFEASTRSDLFELMQETSPLDAAALARLTSRQRDPARHDRRESRRLRRESGRLAAAR
jgi:hypothetical protein